MTTVYYVDTPEELLEELAKEYDQRAKWAGNSIASLKARKEKGERVRNSDISVRVWERASAESEARQMRETVIRPKSENPFNKAKTA